MKSCLDVTCHLSLGGSSRGQIPIETLSAFPKKQFGGEGRSGEHDPWGSPPPRSSGLNSVALALGRFCHQRSKVAGKRRPSCCIDWSHHRIVEEGGGRGGGGGGRGFPGGSLSSVTSVESSRLIRKFVVKPSA